VKRFLPLVALIVVILLIACQSLTASPDHVPRITKEQLKPLLGSPQTAIIDVRSAPEYNHAQERIKGSIRVEPQNVKAIIDKYPKDKTLVLYCS
jgi:rhodanese-related sulfurtransferase